MDNEGAIDNAQKTLLSIVHCPLSIPYCSMRRLALCITELHVGGAERALCDLAVRLDRSRFDVAVYSLQARPADDAKSCVPMLEAAGIPVFFLEMKGPWSLPAGFFKLRRLLKKRKPDIFLSFLFHANFLGRLAARSVGVQHILSGIRVAEKKAKWHLLLDRWTSRFVEQYVCVSQSVADFSETVGGLPRSKLVVIPNGVDVERFKNAGKADLSAVGASPETKKAIFIGRFDHQKGVDRLLDLAPDWLERCPDWELLVVGERNAPKSDTSIPTCPGLTPWAIICRPFRVIFLAPTGRHNLAQGVSPGHPDGAAKRVHFLDWRPDIPELLAASHLLVLPSRWEGMPNVVLQAMAAGLPIVSTPVEGIAELLGDAAAEQIAEIDQFVERLIAVPQIPGLGKRNQERAMEHFSVERTVAAYETLFR